MSYGVTQSVSKVLRYYIPLPVKSQPLAHLSKHSCGQEWGLPEMAGPR